MSDVKPPQGEGIGMVIAGGGTGGHLFPGIAIAEEFLRRDRNHRVLFIGTERGIERRVLGPLGLPLRTLKVEGIKGRGIVRALAALAKLPESFLDSWRILRAFAPQIVVGVGGYASGPAVLAARFAGIPTAIAEQNATPGLTNRLLGRFADRIFLTFAATGRWFSAPRTRVTGNPVRASFLTTAGGKRQEGTFTLLIFGGSQGSRAINRIAGEALPALEPLKGSLRIIHQTGEREREAVAAAYRARGFTAEVTAFIDDMAATYRQADLLLCRAGATSIAEIAVSGKAAILIPLPTAVADHQTGNARLLAEAGAALLMPEAELDGPRLAEAITRLFHDREALCRLETNAAALGNRRAAADIVDACLALAVAKAARPSKPSAPQGQRTPSRG